MSLSLNNTSVMACLLGLLLLMTGFVGFMAHTFSNTTAELEGVKLVDTKDIADALESSDKVCVVTTIHSDDTFDMPDNHQKAIKGRIYICAIWPDNTQNVLLDWNHKSNYLRIPDGTSKGFIHITPRSIECDQDTSTLSQLKLTKTYNNLEVRYFKYKFNLNGIYTKGEPRIILQREYIPDSAKVALSITKSNADDSAFEVTSVVPYSTAKARQNSISNAKTIYIIIAAIGIVMFFIPEKQAQNTITNTRQIVSKIINDIKD